MKLLILLLSIVPIFANAATINFSCDYKSYSDEKGNQKVSEKFILNFIIDAETGKSYMLGNNGSTDVIAVQKTKGRMAFIEITETGNVMTTAIDNSLSSVHSRNTVIGDKLVASQYYGTCSIK